ncbi:hypothetical protein [Streptomyces sp. NPDC058335]|uniref:hypothetical protein n=1 Tax=Streptomyces sp. NPDC058335 TaxID=3346451 RepID=UPI00364A5367
MTHRRSSETSTVMASPLFDELIVPSYLSGIAPRDDPRAVYVMGQPGAGKLLAARMVRRAMRLGTTARTTSSTPAAAAMFASSAIPASASWPTLSGRTQIRPTGSPRAATGP